MEGDSASRLYRIRTYGHRKIGAAHLTRTCGKTCGKRGSDATVLSFQTLHGIYYAEMLGPNGECLTSRTTGKRNRDEALLVADDWARNGLPERGGERRSILGAAGIEAALRVVREAPLTTSDALRIVQELRARGLITLEVRSKSGPASEPFGAWLRAFWKYDGAYIAERLAHGQRATRRLSPRTLI